MTRRKGPTPEQQKRRFEALQKRERMLLDLLHETRAEAQLLALTCPLILPEEI